jgi:hypothetical protein
MRTTLKRGIGQVGGHNGNGHSAAQPLFGPIVRYHQPGPRKRSVTGLIMRAFGWLVLAAAVIGSGAAGGLYLYGHETLASVVNPRISARRDIASRTSSRGTRRSHSSRVMTSAARPPVQIRTRARTRTR